jgi:hypothetical protein
MVGMTHPTFKNSEFIQSKKKRGAKQVLKMILNVVVIQKK